MSEKQSKLMTNHLSQYGDSKIPASIADPTLRFAQEQEDLHRQMLASAVGADFSRQAQADYERTKANAIGDFSFASVGGKKPPYGIDSIGARVHENFRRDAGRVEVAAFNAAGLDSSNLVSRSFGQTQVLTEEIDLIRQQLSTIGLAKISNRIQSKFGSPRLSVESKPELQVARIEELEGQLKEQAKIVEDALAKIDKLESQLSEETQTQKYAHILQRVHEKTHARLKANDASLIKTIIPSDNKVEAFLLSVDIRRSTELMLNAKDAEKFALFLNELSTGLAQIIKDGFGIFDKFTGDGALAFFTESFSGKSAALSVLIAAEKAHSFFSEHYKSNRGSFNSVLVETGLGIGIDYGDVNILRLSDGLTAVGKPVVYACRFAGAEAGTTFVNHGAFEMMRAADGALQFEEASIDIKHHGKHLAYRPKNSPRSELIKEPDWFSSNLTND